MTKLNNIKERGLGKGLSALMGDDIDLLEKNIEKNGNFSNQVVIDIDQIIANPHQPRKHFDHEALNELSISIKESGLIQPIIVRALDNSKFQIIAGERRWRASKMAQLSKVPVVILDITEKEILEVSIIENIQRQDLTVIEEAEGYQKLIEEFSYTQEQLAAKLGKSRSHIANLLRILTLPDEIKMKVNSGELSMGHARALIGVEGNIELAQKLISEKLNVRDTEKLIREATQPKDKSNTKAKKSASFDIQDEDLALIQKHITQKLGMKVIIDDGDDCGKVTIEFHSLEQLDTILRKLGGEF